MWGRTTRALLVASLALLVLAGSAQARQVQQYHYNGEFFEVGGSSPVAIAFSGVDDTLIVVGNGDKENGLKISKFNLNGTPAGFSGLGGAHSFNTGESFLENDPVVGVGVDESGTASDGNFYVTSLNKVYGYAPSGTPLPGFPRSIKGACGLAVTSNGRVWVASNVLGSYSELQANGAPTGQTLFVGAALESGTGVCRIAFDASGNFYVAKGGRVAKYDPARHFLADFGPSDQEAFSYRGAPLLVSDRGDNTLFELLSSGTDPLVQVDSSGDPITDFGGPDPTHFSYDGLGGSARDIAVDPQTHDVYVLKGEEVEVFARDSNIATVPDVRIEGFEALSGSGATLTGNVDPNGVDTTDCYFEWGLAVEGVGAKYSSVAPCAQGNVLLASSGQNSVTAAISGLKKGATYNFRLVAKNVNGIRSFSANRELNASDAPVISNASADHITSDSARIHFKVNPNGDNTSYHVEVGTDGSYGSSFPVPDATLARKRRVGAEEIEVILSPQAQAQEIHGLNPATEYHYRVVAENAAGITEGEDHVFRTFALPSVSDAGCSNKQARQQTSSGELLDCRGYELVSSPDTGGYDVRSGLSPEVSAISTSSAASDSVLYSMRSGTIPGVAGHPTNRGADPYLAARGSNGWSTRYVGLASNNPFATGPFASPLSGFDEALDAFSFGGSEICGPCFEDGSTDVPLRRGSNDIAQGMAGSIDPPSPANPAGIVKKPLSADGSHLVFETTAQFEPEGNSNGTDATIYSRDLKAGTTEVISTDESGSTIQAGDDLAELDVSKDGSRTLFGEEISADSEGNRYYHLYLHIAGTPESVDLMPGATEGALYAGMTEDGTRAFFTTKEPLAAGETDESADAYEDEVQGPGAATPQILSQGSGAGDTDSCSPPGDPDSWNVPSGEGKCDVLAFAGGAGVASQAGDFYFMSPELLDGANGTQDQANLYLVEGGSSTPKFVATVDSSLAKPPPPPPGHPFVTDSFGGSHSFQDAGVAVDRSSGQVYLAEYAFGQAQLRRYTSSGDPAIFSAGPGTGTNLISGFEAPPGPAGSSLVAFDNSGGVLDDSFYVASQFFISLYSSSGGLRAFLEGWETGQGFFEPCGIAVDQSDGALYVGDFGGIIWRYEPVSGSAPIGEGNYSITGIRTEGVSSPCTLAADDGKVYASGSSGPVMAFPTGAFTGGNPPAVAGIQIDPSGKGLAVDTETHQLYVRKSGGVAVYGPSGQLVGTFGSDQLSGSGSLAINSSSKHTYVGVSPSKLIEFGYQFTPYAPINNPAIVHATHQAGVHDPSDFQITPDGKYAAFASVMPLDGYDSGGRYEVFRSERGVGPQCLSCAQTLAIPSSDANLTPYGSSLLQDGRVFFTTGEQLTLRDSNEKRDAYEWSDGRQELISTGTSPSDSELLSASSDGTDVFFFTRQKLVPQDENGDNVRLYDAREQGGFEFGPPQFQCAASDECHGASSKAAAPLGAATTAGTPGQFAEEAKPRKCGKGKVKRKGRCVQRKKAHKRAHKRAARERAAKANRGGGK